jgi:uncharacterized MAPEG superfamily protein
MEKTGWRGTEASMSPWLGNPAFVVYAIACLVLSGNLLFLWAYSGSKRAKGGVAINEEDSVRFGAALESVDPPAVARVLRAHANAQATIYPFLILGLVFVLASGSATVATILFGTFTAARLLHSFVYLAAKQPWRTIFFALSGLCILALMAAIVALMISGTAGR